MPDGLSWTEAGGFPEVFTTAYDALFRQAELQMGERVLVERRAPVASGRPACSWPRRRARW